MSKRPWFLGVLSVVIAVACGDDDSASPDQPHGGAGGHAGHGVAGSGGKAPSSGDAGASDAGEPSAGTSGGEPSTSDGGEPNTSDGGEPNAGSSAGGTSGSGAEAGASGAEAAGAGGNEPAPGPRCTQTLYTPGDSLRTSPTTTVVLPVSVDGRQDIFAGAASDGGAILTQLGCTISERATILYDGSLETGEYRRWTSPACWASPGTKPASRWPRTA